jgi:hypothetical protein
MQAVTWVVRMLWVAGLMLGGSTQLRAEQICQPGAHRIGAPATWVRQADGTLVDQGRHLQWQRCSYGQSGQDCAQGQWLRLSVMQAEDLVYRLNHQGFMGHSDWRLPTVDELQSLRRPDCVAPSIDLRWFPNTPAVWFWSSSRDPGDLYAVWYLDFSSGSRGQDDKNLSNALRLVRDLAND